MSMDKIEIIVLIQKSKMKNSTYATVHLWMNLTYQADSTLNGKIHSQLITGLSLGSQPSNESREDRPRAL